MNPIGGTLAAVLVCMAFGASGCHESGNPSMVHPAKVADDKSAQERVGVYFGDIFSDAEKALAALPARGPDPTPF